METNAVAAMSIKCSNYTTDSHIIPLRLSLSNDHNAHKLHLPEFGITRPSLSNDHNAHNMHLPELSTKHKKNGD